MSIKIMSEVWEHAPFVGTDLLILLSLADMANDDRECWPGLKHVAHKGRITVQQAIHVLQNIELQGVINIKHRTSPERGNISNMYYIKPVSEWDLLTEYERCNPTNAQQHSLLIEGNIPYINATRENKKEPSLETKLETKEKPIPASSDASKADPHPKRHYFEAVAKGVFEISDFKGLSPASLKRIGLLEKTAKTTITTKFPHLTDEQGALLLSKYCAAEKFKPNLQGQTKFELGLSAYLEKNSAFVPGFLAQQPPPKPEEPTEFVDPELVKKIIADTAAKLSANDKKITA